MFYFSGGARFARATGEAWVIFTCTRISVFATDTQTCYNSLLVSLQPHDLLEYWKTKGWNRVPSKEAGDEDDDVNAKFFLAPYDHMLSRFSASTECGTFPSMYQARNGKWISSDGHGVTRAVEPALVKAAPPIQPEDNGVEELDIANGEFLLKDCATRSSLTISHFLSLPGGIYPAKLINQFEMDRLLPDTAAHLIHQMTAQLRANGGPMQPGHQVHASQIFGEIPDIWTVVSKKVWSGLTIFGIVSGISTGAVFLAQLGKRILGCCIGKYSAHKDLNSLLTNHPLALAFKDFKRKRDQEQRKERSAEDAEAGERERLTTDIDAIAPPPDYAVANEKLDFSALNQVLANTKATEAKDKAKEDLKELLGKAVPRWDWDEEKVDDKFAVRMTVDGFAITARGQSKDIALRNLFKTAAQVIRADNVE